jgi:hypothetical protein
MLKKIVGTRRSVSSMLAAAAAAAAAAHGIQRNTESCCREGKNRVELEDETNFRRLDIT